MTPRATLAGSIASPVLFVSIRCHDDHRQVVSRRHLSRVLSPIRVRRPRTGADDRMRFCAPDLLGDRGISDRQIGGSAGRYPWLSTSLSVMLSRRSRSSTWAGACGTDGWRSPSVAVGGLDRRAHTTARQPPRSMRRATMPQMGVVIGWHKLDPPKAQLPVVAHSFLYVNYEQFAGKWCAKPVA
jgi:hypothetical protein